MSTITNILGTDNITDSREVINTNFDNLNADKIEASAIANFETTTQLNARDTANRDRANHTGTQTASTISDFDTEVSNNTDVNANTTARHTHSNKTILDNTTASFTTADETKLDGIEVGAEVNTLNDVIAGTNITIDKTDPLNPIISSTGGGGGSGDLLAANNLSDLDDIPTARSNLDVYSTTETDNLLDEKALKDLTLLDSINLNTITDNGFYCANATCTNLPESGVKTRLRVNQDPSNSDLAMQEALTTTTLISYVRTTANGGTTWTTWARIKATDETKALDTAVVKLTGNQTIAGIKTFSSKVNITYGEGIYNNTVTANPVIKSDYDFAGTGFGDSTRITPGGNLVTTNAVYSANNRNGSIGNFHIAGQLETTGVIQLGHASDTTLSRVSAGIMAIEGKTVATTDGTVNLTGDQTIAGIKTFSSFPVTPSSAPTTNYQVANKKYVDDNAGGVSVNTITATRLDTAASGTITYSHSLGKIPKCILVQARRPGGTSDGGGSEGSWLTGNVNKSAYVGALATDHGTSATYAIYTGRLSTTIYIQAGVIQNVTSTTFDVVWTYTGTGVGITVPLHFTLLG